MLVAPDPMRSLLQVSKHRLNLSRKMLLVQEYVLKRLVRGLSSARQGARQGYALALTHLLSHIPALTPEAVLAAMASELQVSSQAKVIITLSAHLHPLM